MRQPKAIKELWREPVGVHSQKHDVWFYRDGRGIELYVEPTTNPASFRLSERIMRKYLRELDTLRRWNRRTQGKEKGR